MLLSARLSDRFPRPALQFTETGRHKNGVMTDIYPTLVQCAVVATALKLLLLPAYKSTDFEVHRNWLAITHSRPVKQWYFEDTSEWTLDYPPFFAYFEWLLSWPATLADSAMLEVENFGYSSWATICFQRGSVLVTETLLIYALYRYIESSPAGSRHTSHAAALSILLSPGFLIIDHIHFQYNGFLYGMLILSMVLARKQTTMLHSGVLFATLLCFKHIYLYLAPAYLVYLLRSYCLDVESMFRPRFQNVVRLGSSVIGIVCIAFGPFGYWQQLDQLKSRLFPFSRGLCHAYWAPNIWAMYSFVDRVLIIAGPHLGLALNENALQSVTRGLVGDTSFAILPAVTKEHCFVLTIAFQVIALTKLWFRPEWEIFIGSITLCAYASFLFGWHVHEKAVLLVLIPFTLLALKDRRYLGAFRPLAVAGHLSLFPLLFTAAEFSVKTSYTISWLLVFLYTFDRLATAATRARVFFLDRFSLLYIAVSIPLIAYCSFLHQHAFGDRYEFLPLMLTSTYCALGVIGSWLGFMVVYFTS